tara:strand:- start:809 stop:1183 length:375 start_codon:yes stop_codon:yes gene_type:complete
MGKEIDLKETAEEKEIVKAEEDKLALAEKLKLKHQTRAIFFIEVESEDEPDKWLGAYFRKPNLKEYSYFTSLVEKNKIQALQDLMGKIFLEGDREILDDDDYFLSAMSQIESIVSVQASRIKKY